MSSYNSSASHSKQFCTKLVSMMMIKATFVVFLVLVMIQLSGNQFITNDSSLVSDGIHRKSQSKISELHLTATTVTCEPMYGFLPCTTEVWGQLFLIVVYEYLLYLSKNYISSGSNIFFEMFGTGIFGASLFHILGIFPQVTLVLVTGVTESDDTIKSTAAMGMGVLAGSAIINLTMIWGSVVAVGSHNLLQTSSLSNLQSKKLLCLTGYGVITDHETKETARIMLASMTPFLVLQLAKVLNSSSSTRVVVLVSLIITVVFLFAYCIYQVFQLWIQNRRLEYLMQGYVVKNLLQVLCTPEGKPDEAIIRELFDKIDQNNKGRISATEMMTLILGIQIEEVGLNNYDFVSKVMEGIDTSGDSYISETQIIQGLSKWLSESNLSVNNQDQSQMKLSCINSKVCDLEWQETTEEQAIMVDKKQESNNADKPAWWNYQPAWWNYAKAGFLILLGTALSVLLGKPLTHTLKDFAIAINIPPFLVSYFVVPLGLSSRQAYIAITAAKQKTEKAISLTLSEIYGGVFMNNILGLAVFLVLVYVRDLSWDVSAEILVVLIICSVMGLPASLSSKFPFWSSIIAYPLYPISIGLLYVLTTVFGWG